MRLTKLLLFVTAVSAVLLAPPVQGQEKRSEAFRRYEAKLEAAIRLIRQEAYGPAQKALIEAARLYKDLPEEEQGAVDEYAALLHWSVVVLRGLGEYRKAVQAADAALRRVKGFTALPKLAVARLLALKGDTHRILWEFDEAEKALSEAHAIARKLPAAAADVLDALILLGQVQFERGRMDVAEQHFSEAEQLINSAPRRDTEAQHVWALTGLGHIAVNRGRYLRALDYLRRALEIAESIDQRRAPVEPDDRHVRVAAALEVQACAHLGLGDRAAAEASAGRALSLRERKVGNAHYTLLLPLDLRAQIAVVSRRKEQANEFVRRGLAITSDPALPRGAQCFAAVFLEHAAQLQYQQGKPEKAVELATRALAVRRQHAKDHPGAVAIGMHHLGIFQMFAGQNAPAEGTLREAAALMRTTLGPDYPVLADAGAILGLLHARAGRWDAATAATTESLKLLSRHTRSVVPGLPERRQPSFFRYRIDPLYWLAFTIARERASDQTVVDRSATWVLNWKGSGVEALAENVRLARLSQDPKLKGPITRLLKVWEEFAALACAPARVPGVQVPSKGLQILAEEEAQLLTALHVASEGRFKERKWQELEGVRRAIPQDAVLVEVARFPLASLSAQDKVLRWGPARYVAWIIPPLGGAPYG